MPVGDSEPLYTHFVRILARTGRALAHHSSPVRLATGRHGPLVRELECKAKVLILTGVKWLGRSKQGRLC